MAIGRIQADNQGGMRSASLIAIALPVGASIVMSAGCALPAVPSPRPAIASHCAKPPASPIGVAATQHALQRQGIRTRPDSTLCQSGASYIVTTLTRQTGDTSVFCSVEKRPDPLTSHQRHTLYEGAAPGGKAWQLLLSNVDCRVYGSDSVISQVRAALRKLGGTSSRALRYG